MHCNAVSGPGNLSLERSGCKIVGFHSRSPRSWAQQVNNLRYINPIAFTTKLKKPHEIMLNTFSWEPTIETWAQEINGGRNELWGLESWTVPPSWKLYFNPWWNLVFRESLQTETVSASGVVGGVWPPSNGIRAQQVTWHTTWPVTSVRLTDWQVVIAVASASRQWLVKFETNHQNKLIPIFLDIGRCYLCTHKKSMQCRF